MKKTLMIFLIICAQVFSAKAAVVKRDRAIVRSGPGSFYEVEAELAKGTNFEILEEEKGWYRIEVVSLEGYISSKVTEERQQSDDVFSKMGQKQTDLKISQHGMSAGVKGFAERFTKTFDGSPDFITYQANFKLDVKAFKDFRKQTYRDFDLKKNLKQLNIPPARNKEFFSMAEEGLGIGIAARISAAFGLYRDQQLLQYINQIGNLLVDVTDVYDINFKFFILDTDKVNAYACPGGIVFITKGMLKTIRTEAELALVLAHEIAHIARHHGMLEMAERRHHIAADDAFAEMEMEIGKFGIEQDEKMKAVEEELEELSFQIFENLVNGRLQQYEKEADELAVIYASRAGWNGRELLTILNRLKAGGSQSTNDHYTQQQIAERLGWAEKFLNNLKLPAGLFSHKTRWQQRSGM